MYTSEQLIEGNIYTRKELSKLFHIKDATINNGVFQPADHQSIWLFITELKTSHQPQLHDLLVENTLYWDGQPSGRTDRTIIEHEANGLELIVFYRKRRDEYPDYGFRYEGRFRYISHKGSKPSHFVLQRVSDTLLATIEKDIEAYQIEENGISYREGKLRTVLINRHERNPKLRREAIKLHGTTCQVCGFSFAKHYGEHGKDFIEVHHLKQVANYEGEVEVNPATDMAVLCANCHRMIHRHPERPLSIQELQQLRHKASNYE